jgi:tyrosine-protein phosphatase YwqE
LPCTDSSPECVQQLTEAAIANSSQLKLLGEKITIIEQQLVRFVSSLIHRLDKGSRV